MSLPDQNLLFNLTSPGQITLVSAKLPSLVQDEYLRIAIEFCGVCGTDLSFFHGHRVEGYPICLGHEHCGTIIRTGKSVTHLHEGDFVAVDPNFKCGNCKFCIKQLGHLCEQFGIHMYSNRGYARYVDIHQNYVHALPKFRHRHHGALVEPISVAIHALDTAGLRKTLDSTIAILGAGNIGSLLVFTILATYKDIKVSIFDINPEKSQLLKALYGDKVNIISSTKDVENKFDFVFEATGSAAGFQVACELLAKQGTLTVVSRYYGQEPTIPNGIITWKDPTIRISHLNGGRNTMSEASQIILSHWTDNLDKTLGFYEFENIQTAFSEYENNGKPKKIIKILDGVR